MLLSVFLFHGELPPLKGRAGEDEEEEEEEADDWVSRQFVAGLPPLLTEGPKASAGPLHILRGQNCCLVCSCQKSRDVN